MPGLILLALIAGTAFAAAARQNHAHKKLPEEPAREPVNGTQRAGVWGSAHSRAVRSEDEAPGLGGEGGGGGSSGGEGEASTLGVPRSIPVGQTPFTSTSFVPSAPPQAESSTDDFAAQRAADEAEARKIAAEEAAEAAAEQAAQAPSYPTPLAQQQAIAAGVPAGPGGVVPYESGGHGQGFVRVGKPRPS